MAETNFTTSSKVTMDDGVRLNVKILGDDPTKKKPLLISLHGAPGLSTHLEPEASYSFLNTSFRVLLYDARGSGASDLTGPYTHDRWIRDIDALREWAGAETFVLAGASYGAFVALDYAVSHNDRLSGLVLRGVWANGKLGAINAIANILTSDRVNPNKARQVRLWSGTLLDDKDFEEAIGEIFPFYTPPEHAALPKPAGQEGESTEFKGTVAYHSATQNFAFGVNMPQFDVRDQLHKIKAPILLVVGRYDYVTPVFASQQIAESIPRATLEIFEHSGHSPPSDEPAKFEEILSAWLKAEGLCSSSTLEGRGT